MHDGTVLVSVSASPMVIHGEAGSLLAPGERCSREGPAEGACRAGRRCFLSPMAVPIRQVVWLVAVPRRLLPRALRSDLIACPWVRRSFLRLRPPLLVQK